MEPVDIATTSVRSVIFLATNHPILSVLSSVFLFFLLVRFYCKLTTGMCDCDQRMDGKTVFITGATAGIGKETAKDMARRGARVILGCRDPDKGRRVLEEIAKTTGNSDLRLQRLDLASFASVRQCARDIRDHEDKLHVLINNAGIVGEQSRETTKDGCEKIMQSNHLGHFLLTSLLLDLMKKSKPSRIVNVASNGHHRAKLNLDDLNCENNYTTIRAYGNSKLANLLFTKELASKLSGTGVTVNALHPGVVKTEIAKDSKSVLHIALQLLFFWLGKTPEEGAQTSIYIAVHPDLEKKTGKYFSDCKEVQPSKAAQDKIAAKRLWELSEKIVGISK